MKEKEKTGMCCSCSAFFVILPSNKAMPRITMSGSTPETRRRQLLLVKSSSIEKRVKIAVADAKSVVAKSGLQQRLSYAKELIEPEVLESIDSLECTTILPPLHHASSSLLLNDDDQLILHARVSSTTEQVLDHKISSSSSVYHVELAPGDDESEPHFISCFTFEPECSFSGRRRRTSSMPASIIVLDVPSLDTQRSSSLANLTLTWQNNPQKSICLFNRQYNCQPMSSMGQNTLTLCNDNQIDLYNITTGQCEETIRFQSSHNNYRAMCYNRYRHELFVASTSFLYIYDIRKRLVIYQLHLPGIPFHLDYNKQIRYLAINSSSIYHGYFALTSACTTTVLSCLSQIGLKHVCDLEFDDGTMHGLHAFEQYVGIVIRYGRYSARQKEDYCLYVYDSLLNNQLHRFDLNDIGYITGLTGYERTLDWILCDRQRTQLIFVNGESIEYVQYDETINQCLMLDESGFFAVWLTDRVLLYKMEMNE